MPMAAPPTPAEVLQVITYLARKVDCMAKYICLSDKAQILHTNLLNECEQVTNSDSVTNEDVARLSAKLEDHRQLVEETKEIATTITSLPSPECLVARVVIGLQTIIKQQDEEDVNY